MRAADAPLDTDRSRRHVALLVLVAAILAILPLLSAFPADWIWDDHAVFEHNPKLRLQHVAGYWTQGEWAWSGIGRPARYNPVTWTLFSVQGSLFLPPTPGAFRAVSIALHAVNAALVALLLFRLQRGRGRAVWLAALGGALVFAWHPAQAEVALWPSGQSDAHAMLFLLLGAHVVLGGGPRRMVGGTLVLGLSVLCKESYAPMALVLPLGLALLAPWKQLRWAWGTATAVLLLLGVRGVRALIDIEVPDVVAGRVNLPKLAGAFTELVRMGLAPSEVSQMRAVPTAPTLTGVLCAVALVGAVAIGLWRWNRDGGRLLALGGTLFAAGIGLSALAAAAYELLPDRYLYSGSVGLAAATVGAVQLVGVGRRRIAGALLAVVLLGCAAITWQQGVRWVDEVAFFRWEVDLYPDLPQTNYFLGLTLTDRGRPAEALPWLERAAERGPQLSQVWGQLAFTRRELGDRAGALAAAEQGLALQPGEPQMTRLRDELLGR